MRPSSSGSTSKALPDSESAAGEPRRERFGLILRKLRIDAGLSQDGLAERARISAKTIGALEQGARRAPHDDTIGRLAEALSLSNEDRDVLVDAASYSRAHRVVEAREKPKHNLPTQLTSFIERDDLEKIAALLEIHRLVTITGAGGIGKTRTAVELARRQSDKRNSICFVDLSRVADGSLIVCELASALEIETPEAATQLSEIERHLQIPTLLVLDNCEHVLPILTQLVPGLLRRCPQLTILATSREPLSLSFETSYRLPSLVVPIRSVATLAEARSFSALRLFLARAESDGAGWLLNPSSLGAICKICQELDGIPLAIELAASRVPTLGLEMLLTKLRSGVTLSGKRDYPQRHQTMMATIAWSYNLLDDTERTLLRRLSVFGGTFAIDAMERVCADDDLPVVAIVDAVHRLTQKSLVTIVHPIILGKQMMRYRLLSAIRSFANDMMTVSEKHNVRNRYFAWLCDLADTAHHNLAGLSNISIVAELDNARSAVAFCIADGSEQNIVNAASIVGGLRRAWGLTNRFSELRFYVEYLIETLSEEEHPGVASRLLLAAGNYTTGGQPLFSIIERAVPLLIRDGNAVAAAALLIRAGTDHCKAGAFEAANRSLVEASNLLAGSDLSRNRAYWHLLYTWAWVWSAQGRVAEALDELAKVRPLLNEFSDPDFSERTYVGVVAAEIEIVRGQPARAIRMLESLIPSDGFDNRLSVDLYGSLAICHIALGDDERATEAVRRGFAIYRDHNDHFLDDFLKVLIIAAAAVAAHCREAYLAAILLGYYKRNLEENHVILAAARPAYESLLRSLNEQLTPPELDRSISEGGTLQIDGLSDLVLSSGLFRFPD
jgi:predicted ATPase/DNA-binding XRE family transcriptional regulator